MKKIKNKKICWWWLFGYRWERKQYNFVETLLYILATCKNLWSCMWPIIFPFKYGNFEPLFQKRILCTSRSPFCFCHKKRGERGISPLSIWEMQLRSLGFRAKKREIHQATNKQTETILCGWSKHPYICGILSPCVRLWLHDPHGVRTAWDTTWVDFFFYRVCFLVFHLSPESSPLALWSLVAGSSASSLGIYSIAAPLLHWLLHVLTHVIVSWLKSAVCVISKECAMVYYFETLFFSYTICSMGSCTRHSISYPIWSRYWIVLGTQFRTQFGAGYWIRHQANNMPLK